MPTDSSENSAPSELEMARQNQPQLLETIPYSQQRESTLRLLD